MKQLSETIVLHSLLPVLYDQESAWLLTACAAAVAEAGSADTSADLLLLFLQAVATYASICF